MVSGVAQAALWNSAWSGATYASISDPTNDGAGGVLEITKLESIYGTDGANTGYFFRMTLASSGAKDVAYMLNFNTDGDINTGGGANNSTYMATGISGIDKIVDTHFDGSFVTGSHYHNFVDGGPLDTVKFDGVALASVGGAADATAGNQIEWFVPSTLLNSTATVRGSIVNLGTTVGGLNPSVTLDITDAFTVVPEPTSRALLAIGLAALGLRRKIG